MFVRDEDIEGEVNGCYSGMEEVDAEYLMNERNYDVHGSDSEDYEDAFQYDVEVVCWLGKSPLLCGGAACSLWMSHPSTTHFQ